MWRHSPEKRKDWCPQMRIRETKSKRREMYLRENALEDMGEKVSAVVEDRFSLENSTGQRRAKKKHRFWKPEGRGITPDAERQREVIEGDRKKGKK